MTVAVGNPAAGAEWTVTVTAGKRWDVIAFSCTFVASAAVATRLPRFQYKDAAGNIVYRGDGVNGGSAAAGTTKRYNHSQGAVVSSNNVTGAQEYVGAGVPPGMSLPAGGSIGSITDLIDVGDQWSAIFLYVEEFDA